MCLHERHFQILTGLHGCFAPSLTFLFQGYQRGKSLRMPEEFFVPLCFYIPPPSASKAIAVFRPLGPQYKPSNHGGWLTLNSRLVEVINRSAGLPQHLSSATPTRCTFDILANGTGPCVTALGRTGHDLWSATWFSTLDTRCSDSNWHLRFTLGLENSVSHLVLAARWS